MKINYNISIFLCLAAILIFCGCIVRPAKYPSDNYIVVETTEGDNFYTIAQKYLNDPQKGWIISEFNGVKELEPGMSLVVPLYPFKLGGVKPAGYQLVPVLSYQQNNLSKKDPVSKFEQHLEYLKKNNFQVISLSRFLDFLNYKSQIPEKSVVITITGAWKSFIDEEISHLVKYGYPATLFIETGDIGTDSTVSWPLLKELADKDIDVQNGSGLNIELAVVRDKLSLEDYFQSIEKKIRDSKKIIEDKIGGSCIYYAFPTGEGNNLVAGILKKYGFKAAFNASGGSNPFYVDSFNINRTIVSPSCSVDELKDKLVVFQDMDLN